MRILFDPWLTSFFPLKTDGYLYTLHELSSTLTSQVLPKAPNGTSSLISNSSIVPPGLPAGAAMAAGESLIPSISHAFSGSYVYVSNRNTGVQDPRGDAIAIYGREKNGSVSFVDCIFTGIDQIRGMEFFGDNGWSCGFCLDSRELEMVETWIYWLQNKMYRHEYSLYRSSEKQDQIFRCIISEASH